MFVFDKVLIDQVKPGYAVEELKDSNWYTLPLKKGSLTNCPSDWPYGLITVVAESYDEAIELITNELELD